MHVYKYNLLETELDEEQEESRARQSKHRSISMQIEKYLSERDNYRCSRNYIRRMSVLDLGHIYRSEGSYTNGYDIFLSLVVILTLLLFI